jgi:hypothetical protein
VDKQARELGREMPPDVLRLIATRAAISEFRGLLSNFVSLHLYDSTWVDELGGWPNVHSHPFLRVVPGDHFISLNM